MDDVRSRPRFRFGIRSLLLLVLMVAAGWAAYGWFYRSFVQPRRHSTAVEALLESLVNRRPQEVTPGQWGSAVAWTLNLHGNSMLAFEASGLKIAAFEERLRGKLAGRVDMGTIDWIWDEYAELCPHGASYQRFKQRMLDEIEQVGPDDDPWGMNVP